MWAATGCSNSLKNPELSQELEIYHWALKDILETWELKEGEYFVIQKETEVYRDLTTEENREVEKDLYEDFITQNRVNQTIPDDFGPNFRLMEKWLISRAGSSDITHFSWDNFREVYNGVKGIITLSSVGFNLNRDIALLYYSVLEDGESGFGRIVVLKKVNNGWVLEKTIAGWVA